MLRTEEIQKLGMKTVYRLMIKDFRFYPSKNKFQIMMAMKEEFRDNQKLTDAKKIFLEQKKARMGLAHLQLYKVKNKEMIANYSMQNGEFNQGMNPKDKDFIYF